MSKGHAYSQRAADGQGKDNILIFEDTAGDGLFDRSKVLIEGLNVVSGLGAGFSEVYVGAAFYLQFIPDADGEDIPDSNSERSDRGSFGSN